MPLAPAALTAFWALANVGCSVALVLVNKAVFSANFKFPMSLTCIHFGFSLLFYKTLAALRFYEPKPLPFTEAFKMAAAGVGSIGFMNISLQMNSVGFYQITKLAIVPSTLAANAILFSLHASRKVKLSLSILLLGLSIATVSDVQLNAPGFVMGGLAVLSTTIFQVWQGSKQREFEMSATQLQAAVAVWQCLQSLAGALALENLCIQLPPADAPAGEVSCDTAINYILAPHNDLMGAHIIMLILATCFLALGTNFSSFCLIGRTSATSFQVIGHAKTCLVLTGGFLLWPVGDASQLFSNVVGVSVAMAGCVLYGHVRIAESSGASDVCDAVCPSAFLSFAGGSGVKYAALATTSDASAGTPRTKATAAAAAIVRRVGTTSNDAEGGAGGDGAATGGDDASEPERRTA